MRRLRGREMLTKFLFASLAVLVVAALFGRVGVAQDVAASVDQYAPSSSPPSSAPPGEGCPELGPSICKEPVPGPYGDQNEGPLLARCTTMGDYDDEGHLTGSSESCSAQDVAQQAGADSRVTHSAFGQDSGGAFQALTGFFFGADDASEAALVQEAEASPYQGSVAPSTASASVYATASPSTVGSRDREGGEDGGTLAVEAPNPGTPDSGSADSETGVERPEGRDGKTASVFSEESSSEAESEGRARTASEDAAGNGGSGGDLVEVGTAAENPEGRSEGDQVRSARSQNLGLGESRPSTEEGSRFFRRWGFLPVFLASMAVGGSLAWRLRRPAGRGR
jgi:hypothetical protein